MRARVPFPEWVNDLGTISGSFLPVLFYGFRQVCPLFLQFISPRFTSPSSVVSVRDSIAPLFLPTSDYINNYLSITLCYILVSCLTRRFAQSASSIRYKSPRQHTGLHQVIHTPSCFRRLFLNTFYKIGYPRWFFERIRDPFSLSKVESSCSA